ncbi:MAG: hypothetical protein P8Z81_12785 [Deinococcales bacterium]
MMNALLISVARARAADMRRRSGLLQLRRAGYADAERSPRLARHWTNR